MTIATMFAALLVLATAAHAADYIIPADGMRRPDPAATPGVVALTDTAKVCGPKWGKDARHVTEAMKRDVYAAYGAVKRKDVCCEVDHLVSKELGGADHIKNLWPQPWTQARMKDRVENALHKEVCAGTLSLAEAQRRITADWYREWRRLFGGKKP